MVVGTVAHIGVEQTEHVALCPRPIAGIIEGEEQLEACRVGCTEGIGDLRSVVCRSGGDVESKGVNVGRLGKADLAAPCSYVVGSGIVNLSP